MKVLFLSDLHLGAGYIDDHRAHERRIVDFLRREGAGADHIYLLGDVLDYWYEYRTVVPKGFVRFFGALAALADSGVKITWFTGNHDIWLYGYFRDEMGIEIIDEPYVYRNICGTEFILAHGDRVGHSTASFRFICSLFRNKFCQRLYSAIHPGLTIPFALWWSRSSRESHSDHDASSPHSIDRVVADADELASRFPDAKYLIEGHHHVALERALPSTGCRLVVLGDWITHSTYAVWDGANLDLREFV